jgi:hypothetical protein
MLPKVNIELFNLVLEDFVREFGVGKNKHIILTKDLGWLAWRCPQVIVPSWSTLGIYALSFSRITTVSERLWHAGK